MNDQSSLQNQTISRGEGALVLRYIETPHTTHKPERINTVLEKRMREFLLARRQKQWLETGE